MDKGESTSKGRGKRAAWEPRQLSEDDKWLRENAKEFDKLWVQATMWLSVSDWSRDEIRLAFIVMRDGCDKLIYIINQDLPPIMDLMLEVMERLANVISKDPYNLFEDLGMSLALIKMSVPRLKDAKDGDSWAIKRVRKIDQIVRRLPSPDDPKIPTALCETHFMEKWLEDFKAGRTKFGNPENFEGPHLESRLLAEDANETISTAFKSLSVAGSARSPQQEIDAKATEQNVGQAQSQDSSFDSSKGAFQTSQKSDKNSRKRNRKRKKKGEGKVVEAGKA